MRPHNPIKQDRRALPLGPLTGGEFPYDAALKALREQRRGRRA